MANNARPVEASVRGRPLSAVENNAPRIKEIKITKVKELARRARCISPTSCKDG